MSANVWSDGWDPSDERSGGLEARRLPRGERLGATLYRLGPGDAAVFHFHHANEELLIVLRGRPTLRRPDGERRLAEGDVVHFPVGPDGAHGLQNETDAEVRYAMVSTQARPEVVEYPDAGRISAFAGTASQTGERLRLIHDVEPRP